VHRLQLGQALQAVATVRALGRRAAVAAPTRVAVAAATTGGDKQALAFKAEARVLSAGDVPAAATAHASHAGAGPRGAARAALHTAAAAGGHVARILPFLAAAAARGRVLIRRGAALLAIRGVTKCRNVARQVGATQRRVCGAASPRSLGRCNNLHSDPHGAWLAATAVWLLHRGKQRLSIRIRVTIPIAIAAALHKAARRRTP
jgi:hypothetical protein